MISFFKKVLNVSLEMIKKKSLLNVLLLLIPIINVGTETVFPVEGLTTNITSSKISSQSAEFYIQRSYENADNNEYEKVRSDLDKAIEIDPNNSNTYYLRGWAKKELKDYPGALKDFEKTVALEPKDEDAYFQIVFITSGLDLELQNRFPTKTKITSRSH